jgi:PelA/Pel-15E family pectate lyase
MGHVFLDAYHATGDEYYYKAAESVASALIWGQHPSGGWNYVVDFAGDRSLRDWYATTGKNAWRLEEFQHYYGNATFDDQVTTDAAIFLLRLYFEKLDSRYKAPVDKAINFVLTSQYPLGAWPQRFPISQEFSKKGLADYSSYYTFNDDVSWENISFLILCYEMLGEQRLLDPINRAMNFFLLSQQGQPNPGWALQYTLDLKPAAARTYEPLALATHTSATNIDHLLTFFEWTGDTRYLARVPEALDWLDRVKLAKPDASGRTHPTYIELGTNKPVYVHRRGSNVFNGEYFFDYNPARPIGHYGQTRKIDVSGLRKRYEQLLKADVKDLAKKSPLTPGPGAVELPRYFADRYASPVGKDVAAQAQGTIKALNETGYWPAALPQNSHPFTHDGNKNEVASGDFGTTHVGDDTDTSPYNDGKTPAISTAEYLKNMNVLIQYLVKDQPAN